MVRTRIAGLVAATHPIPALSVTALVATLVAARGAGAPIVAWVVASTAAGQASVGWSNDYLDRFEDARVGRREKPLVAQSVSGSVVSRAAALAFAASVALSVPLGLPEAVMMGAAVASAWTYNLGLKRTAGSWLPYAVSFGLVPVYAWMATGARAPAWLVAAAAILGVAGHLTNVLPDLEADRASGRRGLPHRLGPGASLLAACGLLVAALSLVLVASGAPRTPSPLLWIVVAAAAVLIAGVFVSVRRGRPRTGFHLTIASAAAIAGVLVLSLRAVPE
ncbi:MAG: UbiA family prenyltransferase [Actinomycetota bacterium]